MLRAQCEWTLRNPTLKSYTQLTLFVGYNFHCGGVLYTMPKIPVYLHSIKDVFFVEWRIHDFPNGRSADNLLFGNPLLPKTAKQARVTMVSDLCLRSYT